MTYYYLAFIPGNDFGYSIFSPDFREVASQGMDLSECMKMGQDALNIVIEEYAKINKPLPVPMNLEQAKAKIKADLEEIEVEIPLDSIQYQLFPAPAADLTPVRISATFSRYALDIIDQKAKAHGMSRSGFLAAAAQAYV